MNDEKTEGIVLKAVPFKENDRILSLFTPDQGDLYFLLLVRVQN